MPGIEVHYNRYLFFNSDKTSAFRRLREVVSEFGAEVFSTPETQLTPANFTFRVCESGAYDHMTHDVIIRIQLHAYPKRLEDTDDKSEALAKLIAEAIAPYTYDTPTNIGVSMLITEIGWGSATCAPNPNP